MSQQAIFSNQLANLSREELIARFNREVGNPGWTSTRAVYLSELTAAMRAAGIDLSSVLTESGGLNLSQKAELRHGNVLWPV